MLLNRLRAVSSNIKQALMADHKSSQSSSSSSIHNYIKPLPSFVSSPRFKPFPFQGIPEESSDPLISPTSILEPFSPKNPFCSHTFHPQLPKTIPKLDSKGIGVALVCEHDEKQTPKKNNKMVLFGTKLKVQIPTIPASESPNSPSDFGIKTKTKTKTKTPQFSRPGFDNSGNQMNFSPQVLTGYVSMSDLELSEDYTCVISYGTNPKTTHMYENCVLDNCCDKFKSSPKSFLSFCHTCNKKLEQKNDIFIYRGDEAFCSQECRYSKMVLDGIES